MKDVFTKKLTKIENYNAFIEKHPEFSNKLNYKQWVWLLGGFHKALVEVMLDSPSGVFLPARLGCCFILGKENNKSGLDFDKSKKYGKLIKASKANTQGNAYSVKWIHVISTRGRVHKDYTPYLRFCPSKYLNLQLAKRIKTDNYTHFLFKPNFSFSNRDDKLGIIAELCYDDKTSRVNRPGFNKGDKRG